MDNKKLYRAGKGHVLGGVCAGVADYFSIDVLIVRVLWIVLTLVNGIGAAAYVVCLILIPKNPEHEQLPASEQKKAENAGLYIGIGFVIVGLSVAFHRWFDFFFWDFNWLFFHFHWRVVWPILLILVGVWFIYQSSRKEDENEETDEPDKKPFYRSPDKKMIGGVCGGLAEYWNVDVTLVRVGYALATIFTAFWLGVVTYIVMLVVVKERDQIPPEIVEPEKKKPQRRKTAARKEEKKQEQQSKAKDQETQESQENEGEANEQK